MTINKKMIGAAVSMAVLALALSSPAFATENSQHKKHHHHKGNHSSSQTTSTTKDKN